MTAATASRSRSKAAAPAAAALPIHTPDAEVPIAAPAPIEPQAPEPAQEKPNSRRTIPTDPAGRAAYLKERNAKREAAAAAQGIIQMKGYATPDGKTWATMREARQHQAYLALKAAIGDGPGIEPTADALIDLLLAHREAIAAYLKAAKL